MMNVLPLTNTPMEIMGGAPKSGRPLPHSDKCGGAEDGGSFASTLKAVHDHNQAQNDVPKTEEGETHGGRETNETQEQQPNDKKSETARSDISAEGMPAPGSPSENAEAAEAPAAPAADISATAQAENAASDENENQGRAGTTPRAGIQLREAAGDKVKTAENGLEEGNPQRTTPEAATTTKETLETAPQQLSGSLKGASSDAAPTVAVARSDAPKTMDQPAEDLPENNKTEAVLKVSRDETGGKALRAEDSPSAGDGDAGKNDRSEMGRFAKQMQSKATGGSGEALRDAAKPSASPESHVASGERSSKGETSPNPSAPANEAVRESPLARSNEASGHALDRQGAHEPSLSFATTATTGRAEATSSGSGAATTMAATTERFHQDNFNQLVERAVFTLRGEQSEARIALKPDQLGHVQMRVVTEHHLVSIKIMAESPVARDLIHAHAHHLKSELQQQGLTVEHIEVSVSDGQGDAYRGERQRETFLRQLASQGLSEQKDETPRLSHGTPRHLSGRSRSSGIDYFA